MALAVSLVIVGMVLEVVTLLRAAFKGNGISLTNKFMIILGLCLFFLGTTMAIVQLGW